MLKFERERECLSVSIYQKLKMGGVPEVNEEIGIWGSTFLK